jgi:hypothetical protein
MVWAERADLPDALDGPAGHADDHAMDPASFHKLRIAVQENALPAGPRDAGALERRLHGELHASALFDQIEVGRTANPDQFVIALCRCAPGVDPEDAAPVLERLWAAVLGPHAWEAHGLLATDEIVDFEGAMTLPDGRHYLTVHVLAMSAVEPAAGLGVAQPRAVSE